MMRPGLFPVLRPGFLPPALGLFAICLGTLTVPFDSAVNVAFPYIVGAFGLPIPAIQWVVIAYTLTYAALMLVFGRIGDMLGYRRIFLLGCAWSCIAFLLCAGAHSFAWLLVARFLQGIGAALVLSCGAALATGLYPEAQRTRVLGIYTMLFGIGGALGPMLAGLGVAEWGWRFVFWARAPIALAGFLLACGLPFDRRHHAHAQRFDAAGAALLVAAISALLLGLNQLRDIDRHAAGLVLALLLALAAGAGFVWRELRTPQPILELRYFRDLDFALVNGAQTALNIASFAVLLLMPFYLNRFSGMPLALQGLMLAASNLGTATAAPLGGRWAARVAPRQLALLGVLGMAAGLGTIGFSGAQAGLGLLAAAMFVQGSGLGLFQVAYFDIATATIPKQDRGVAGSLVMMTRTAGVVTGATVLMLIFQALRSAAAGSGDVAAFVAGFQGAFRFAAAIPVAMAALMLWRRWAAAATR
jgi:EmrB/QacA subfamily drug resistance transporter